jgi:hypothetical protein
VPICVGSVNSTEQVIECFLGLRGIAVGANTCREKTVQTKTATNARCRPTLWADARFILDREGHRNAGRTHLKGETIIDRLYNVAKQNQNLCRTFSFTWVSPKIPEATFLRNFRNLTTDDTAWLCRNLRDSLAKNLRKLRRCWFIACDIACEGETDFPDKLFRGA